MHRRSGLPGSPVAEATSLPLSRIFTSTRSPVVQFSAATVTAMFFWSRLGMALMPEMWLFATGSIHTVCQMPLTGVYQMPLGFSTCFPRGWYPLSVPSNTRTTSFCSPLAFR